MLPNFLIFLDVVFRGVTEMFLGLKGKVSVACKKALKKMTESENILADS